MGAMVPTKGTWLAAQSPWWTTADIAVSRGTTSVTVGLERSSARDRRWYATAAAVVRGGRVTAGMSQQSGRPLLQSVGLSVLNSFSALRLGLRWSALEPLTLSVAGDAAARATTGSPSFAPRTGTAHPQRRQGRSSSSSLPTSVRCDFGARKGNVHLTAGVSHDGTHRCRLHAGARGAKNGQQWHLTVESEGPGRPLEWEAAVHSEAEYEIHAW